MKTKKAISLIVLVITIIVMLILAGAIILTLSNNNVITKANEAVDKTNTSQIQTIASTAWLEAKASGKKTIPDLTYEIMKSQKDSGVSEQDLDKYEIMVTPKEVTVVLTKDWKPKWTQDGTIVTDGTTTLTVGDYVDYKASVKGYSDTNGWRVLGAENGKVVLVSAQYVGELEFGQKAASSSKNYIDAVKESQKDWETAVEQLDAVCIPFGKGEYAEYARSITTKDIERMAKIDKTKYEDESNPQLKYGNEITFKWIGKYSKPLYYYISEDIQGVALAHSTGGARGSLVWYDEQDRVWRKSTAADDATEENKITVVDDNNTSKQAKVTVTAAFYDLLETFEESSGAYEILIGHEDTYTYWLAEQCFFFNSHGSYGVYKMDCGSIGMDALFDMDILDMQTAATKSNVNATVVLKDNVTFSEGASEGRWTIN